MRKIIYYSDELEDEFSEAKITPKKIDKNYIYVYHTLFKKFTHFFWLRIIFYPFSKMYLFLKFRHMIIGREKLNNYKNKNYFLYGNHTHPFCDAVIPAIINKTKDCYVIVHPNNVSMPFLGRITPSLGAIPLPDDKEATRNFVNCIDYRVNENDAIAIYPEAHIWPYYTHIRPFKNTAFRYPIKYNSPVFSFTNTYQKRKFSKNPKIVTYIDGPFFANQNIPTSEAKEELRNQVYEKMVERSLNSNIELIKYIKEEKND